MYEYFIIIIIFYYYFFFFKENQPKEVEHQKKKKKDSTTDRETVKKKKKKKEKKKQRNENLCAPAHEHFFSSLYTVFLSVFSQFWGEDILVGFGENTPTPTTFFFFPSIPPNQTPTKDILSTFHSSIFHFL